MVPMYVLDTVDLNTRLQGYIDLQSLVKCLIEILCQIQHAVKQSLCYYMVVH